MDIGDALWQLWLIYWVIGAVVGSFIGTSLALFMRWVIRKTLIWYRGV